MRAVFANWCKLGDNCVPNCAHIGVGKCRLGGDQIALERGQDVVHGRQMRGLRSEDRAISVIAQPGAVDGGVEFRLRLGDFARQRVVVRLGVRYSSHVCTGSCACSIRCNHLLTIERRKPPIGGKDAPAGTWPSRAVA